MRKLKFVLVIPPSPFLIDDRAFPFLGPLQIGALARREGHEVAVADLTGFKQRNPHVVHANLEEVMEEAKKLLYDTCRDADVVGFYSLAAQHPHVCEFNRFIREAYPNVVTVLGGPHANTAPTRCLEDDFDYIVVSDQGGGGGEPGFLELVKRLEQNGVKRTDRIPLKKNPLRIVKDNCEVDGDWKKHHRVIAVPSREGVEWENDKWPLPARDLIDLKSYHYEVGGERATSIVSATGCPYACTYSVTGDTFVFTDEGFQTIESMMVGEHEIETCEHGGQIKKHKINKLVATHEGTAFATEALDEGVRPVFKVTAENGISVKATAEHPFMILVDGVPTFKQVKELKVGDWMIHKTPDYKWPTQYVQLKSIDVPTDSIDIEGSNINSHTITYKKNVRIPTELNEDIAWLTGFLVGDGSMSTDNRPAIHFCVTNDIQEQLFRVIKDNFNIELNVTQPKHTNNMRNGWLNSRHVREFFAQSVGVNMHDKLRVPETIRKSPRKVIESFMRGLLDADGYDCKKQGHSEYLTTVSHQLALEFANLYTMLGHVPTIWEVQNHGYTRRHHFRITTMQNDRIPVERPLYKSRKSGKWYWRTPRNNKSFLGIRRRTLLESGLEHPLNIDGYHYVRVESIEPAGEEKVYDIKVPGPHSFLANGLVSHNCSHWAGYRKMEAKSSSKVAEEIQSIKNNYGWRGFMFYDDEINLRNDFYTDFLPMLKKQNIVWRAFFKNGKNLTTESVFEAMADSGCVSICTGAESADPKILKDIRKGATLEDNTNFVKYAVKYGIAPKVFTQVGLPGETPETIEALRKWLVDMAGEGLADADCSIQVPYIGTPMFESPEKFDITFDKEELDYSKKVILYKSTPGEYTSYVSHKNLTREDLVAARQMIEDDFRKAAGLKPLLHGKDDG